MIWIGKIISVTIMSVIVSMAIIRLKNFDEGNDMDTDEMIDALIAEGYKKVTLYSNHVLTDNESTEQFLLRDEQGDIVARNRRNPDGQGWVLIYWPVDPARSSAPRVLWEIDLTNREEAKILLCMFY
ncbi:hypothetical protein YA29_16520 [Klebsiella aerogenes]|nr:hypothetical protein YA29_16520 [Klebsiella aerogenes]